jgi:hypothetical protein
VTDDDWSGTVEMLLGLDADPYSYDDITDNSWPFKINNKGKENEYMSGGDIDYQQILTYCKDKHTSGGGEGQNIDWAEYYWWAQDDPELPITKSRPYDYAQHYTYMGWYYKRGMAKIWYGMNTDEHLSQPLLHPEEPVDELSYVPHSH